MRLADVGPIASGFWRVTLAIPFFALMHIIERRKERAREEGSAASGSPWFFLLCGLFFASDIACWHLSLQMTTVVNATLLGNFAVIFVTLFGWLFLKERIGGRFLGGLSLSIAGVVMLVLGKGPVGGGSIEGDLVSVMTGLSYAGYLIAMGRLRISESVSLILLATTIVTSLILLPIALLTGERFWPAEPVGWLPLVGLALGSQIFGQMSISYALRHLPMSFSAVVLTIQTVIAAVLAWVLFGEAMGALGIAGAMLVLAGIVLCRRASS